MVAWSNMQALSSGGLVDHLDVMLVLLVHLNTTVGDWWSLLEELVLELLVVFCEHPSLIISQCQKLDFLFFRETTELSKSLLHFSLNSWKDSVILVCHLSSSNTVEG